MAGAGVVPTILQAGYSTLTGALFAFALIKTKNIFIPAFIHALYNFCGMIYTKDGLGVSSMLDFDIGTIIMMTLISIAVGIYVLISVLKYKEEDRIDLYKKFAVTPTEKEE